MEHSVDYTKREPGKLVGGKLKCTRTCAKCGKTGVRFKQGFKNGEPYEQYAHRITVKHDGKGKFATNFANVCTVTLAHLT